MRVLGYPIETVLAEELATAILFGAANTCVRDYADIYTLTGRDDLIHSAVRALCWTQLPGSAGSRSRRCRRS